MVVQPTAESSTPSYAMGPALFPWISALLLASTGGASGNQRESPKVSTENGVIRGKVLEASEDRKVAAFLGVPYARPPIGDLRWTAGSICNLTMRNRRPMKMFADSGHLKTCSIGGGAMTRATPPSPPRAASRGGTTSSRTLPAPPLTPPGTMRCPGANLKT